MDRIKAKLEALRTEADAHAERADAAEAKVKVLEQSLLVKEQENTSLTHKLEVLEEQSDKLDNLLKDAKAGNLAGASSSKDAENLTRKVQVLEEELDKAEKTVKETMEKLRQVDVKAEHFERQVQKVEQEREHWEEKYEFHDQAEKEKYKKLQGEMQELEASLGGL